MAELTEILSSISLTIATLSLLWTYKCKKCFITWTGIFALICFMYAGWHFLSHIHSTDPGHLAVHNLFIIIASLVNAYHSHLHKLSLNINRRKENIPVTVDRRKGGD